MTSDSQSESGGVVSPTALLACSNCGGSGVVDSGGVTPWGAPIDLPCPACKIDRLIVQLSGCCLAALDGSEALEAKPHSYGWSPAYAEVLKLRREHDRLLRELRDTREHWMTMAKDYRTRASEWVSGDTMHTMRLAEAKTLENCAYALAVALQANAAGELQPPPNNPK